MSHRDLPYLAGDLACDGKHSAGDPTQRASSNRRNVKRLYHICAERDPSAPNRSDVLSSGFFRSTSPSADLFSLPVW